MKWSKQNQKNYLQSTCKECEKKIFQGYQKTNAEKFRGYNRQSYLRKVGSLTRISPLENTPEREAQRLRDKANRRSTRAKLARFNDELTGLVTAEAHELRKLRNSLTSFEWHVDHVIPLKNKHICGLHIWSNIAVIPKKLNLQKGNNLAFYA